MGWLKYIFHKHKWFYYGRFKDRFIFECGICHKQKNIDIVTDGYYTPDKVDKIREQMENSVSHLHNSQDKM